MATETISNDDLVVGMLYKVLDARYSAWFYGKYVSKDRLQTGPSSHIRIEHKDDRIFATDSPVPRQLTFYDITHQFDTGVAPSWRDPFPRPRLKQIGTTPSVPTILQSVGACAWARRRMAMMTNLYVAYSAYLEDE